MAAKKTENTNNTKKTQTKKTTAKKQTSKKQTEPKKSNSTAVFLIIILILLGFIAYTYRDRLQVAYQWAINAINEQNAKSAADNNKKNNKIAKNNKKNDKKSPLEKSIEKLDKKTVNPTTTTTIKTKKFEKVTTTTTTVRKITTTTSTTTTVKKAATTTTVTSTTVKKAAVTTTVAVQSKYHTVKVYFTKITDDKLYLCTVNRSVDYKDAPLTETLNMLLQGPTSSEDNQDIVTNIPTGTRLLGATVKNGIAYLNFSSEFENNHYGKEATIYQLEQIVYTATEFGNVDKVQFLIEGKRTDYLGGEGIIIGEPLGRKNF